MTVPPPLLRILAYDRRVLASYERKVMRLGWAAATADRGVGHRSLKDTLVHILNVREAWLTIIPQRRWAAFEEPGRRPDEVSSWSEYRRYRDGVWARVEAAVAAWNDTDLRRRIRAPWMPGSYTLEDAFYQASYEQAHHLGEIIAVLWQADREPPRMTWIENRPPVPRRSRGPAR